MELESRHLVARLLDLTNRQVAAARSGDWSTVDALLDEQAPLAAVIAEWDGNHLTAATCAELQNALVAALAVHQTVRQLAVESAEATRRQLVALHSGRQALGAYSSTMLTRPSSLLAQAR